MIGELLKKISFQENKRRYANLKGIATRCYAYKGPDVIQIDLTNRCNSNCLVCWLHSPFIVDKDTNIQELDFSILKKLINDVAISGTKEIIFSGGGEPFCYPRLWEVLELTQKAGLAFRINTNFTLLDTKDVLRLVSFKKLVSLTVSIWAADADMFVKIHNRKTELFYRVKDNLKFINKIKPPGLCVTIYANINNTNYFYLRKLLGLAYETGCEAIEFGVPDVISKVTDYFLLNAEQLKTLNEDFINISRKLKFEFPGVKIANKKIFLCRILSPMASSGEYNSFVERIPCYCGWLFLRLRANGDFNSCLKSHRIPIGNIYKDSFSSVWNGALQRQFREKSTSLPKDKDYFRLIGNADNGSIGCNRICDNILVNQHYNRIMKYFLGYRFFRK